MVPSFLACCFGVCISIGWAAVKRGARERGTLHYKYSGTGVCAPLGSTEHQVIIPPARTPAAPLPVCSNVATDRRRWRWTEMGGIERGREEEEERGGSWMNGSK